jgi:hypothetical protein
MSLLEELEAKLSSTTPEAKQAMWGTLGRLPSKMRFKPLPGPQMQAYLSPADVLLYGGEAGGGKTALLVGLASQEHRNAIIFRRDATQTDGMQAFGKEVIGDSAKFVGAPLAEWKWDDGRSLKLAGMQHPDDWMKHAGRARDFIGFDEAGEFLRVQVASSLGWLRSPIAGQRCRLVLASNPPRSSDGWWLKEWFGPWLEVNHPDRAKPGEIRWAAMVNAAPVWVDGPEPVEIDGEQYWPISLTFIPAGLKDNPYNDNDKYRASLSSTPEPLRTQLMYGDWSAGVQDDEWQIIPTEWVRQAQQRWREQPPLLDGVMPIPQCAIGVDVAQGGVDHTVLAPRHDSWFARTVRIPGADTPGGSDVAAAVVKHRRDNSHVNVDVGGGWGADAYALLKLNIDAGNETPRVHSYMGMTTTSRRDRTNLYSFSNVRSWALWRMREELDPDQDGGSAIQLPPDPLILADLTAPRYDIRKNVIHAESKADVVKRLKRSTDDGDAIVISNVIGDKLISAGRIWRGRSSGKPKAVMRRPR